MNLLAFIRGEGRDGVGMVTYHGAGADQEELHQACLDLERQGLIRLKFTAFMWIPVYEDITSEHSREITTETEGDLLDQAS